MGVVYMLLASASFVTMSALIKALGSSIPLSQQVFLRCLLATPVLFAILVHRGQPLLVQAKKLLLVRSLFGMTAMHGFFYALTHMPLADAVFISRSQPLIIALLSPLVLGESAPKSAWLAVGCGLCGVALIMRPAMAWPEAAWVALGAAFCAATAQMLVRRLNRTDRPLVIVFNFTLFTALATGMVALPGFVAMSGRQWLLIAGVAIFASGGQLLMTQAYRRDRAPVISAAGYSSILLSVLYGTLFWQEVVQPLTWAGAALIVGSGILLVRSRIGVAEPAARITTL
ncbi:MAG: DMT family transporter [Thermodesulfobacteriota bacterium]